MSVRETRKEGGAVKVMQTCSHMETKMAKYDTSITKLYCLYIIQTV